MARGEKMNQALSKKMKPMTNTFIQTEESEPIFAEFKNMKKDYENAET